MLQITKGVTSFAELNEKATDAFPIINKNIQDLTKNLGDSVESMKNEITQSLTESRKTNEQMIEGIQTSFNETVSNANNKLNDSISQLDDAIQKELETVLKTMAESLSGIAQKFVNDYIKKYDLVVISDYEKGLLSRNLMQIFIDNLQ